MRINLYSIKLFVFILLINLIKFNVNGANDLNNKKKDDQFNNKDEIIIIKQEDKTSILDNFNEKQIKEEYNLEKQNLNEENNLEKQNNFKDDSSETQDKIKDNKDLTKEYFKDNFNHQNKDESVLENSKIEIRAVNKDEKLFKEVDVNKDINERQESEFKDQIEYKNVNNENYLDVENLKLNLKKQKKASNIFEINPIDKNDLANHEKNKKDLSFEENNLLADNIRFVPKVNSNLQKDKQLSVKNVPSTDHYKVSFKKMENKKVKEEEEEEIIVELTQEQLEGKKIYEHALQELEKNPSIAYSMISDAAKLNYEEAKNHYLHSLFLGDLEVDSDLIVEKLNQYSMQGNPLSQMLHGFYYASGIIFKPSQAKAILYYTMAAAANNTYAQMALGYRYLFGINVKQNCSKALKYYRKVAKQVEKTMSTIPSSIIERKRLFDENESPTSYSMINSDMIQYYQVLAEGGDALAQVALGQLHYHGFRGVAKDHRKALKFLKMAASSGNSNAMAFLGKMYLEGSDIIEKNYNLALKYFSLAIDKNTAAGYCGLGTMYLYGKGVKVDYAKAFVNFNKAAEQGLVEAQYQIGIMYYNGYGVFQNYQEAFKYFFLASQAGYALGYYYLGILHAEGLGTVKSCNNAVELFKNVAERGQWSKILMEAFANYKDGKVFSSYLKYSFLSELGYEVAQSNAAALLDNQDLYKYFVTNESYKRAFMYWSRSASQGYSVARVKLGDYYYYGQGINLDFELAAAHYKIASDRSAQALFNLGYMHELGLGLKKDFYLAKRYYDLAADSSNDASVPVFLAKIKLYTTNFLESLSKLKLDDYLMNIDSILLMDYDLYFLTILVIVLGYLIRRQNQN